jgi:hypothetical protein
MSLSRETLVELMALADGELEGAARERAEKLVADSEEARRVVEAMRSPALGAWLGEVVDRRAIAADGIADAVMAGLKQEPARNATGPQHREASREDGGVVRLAGAADRRRARWVPVAASVAAALAMAAGVAVVLRSMGREGAPSAPVASVAEPVRPVGTAPSASSVVAQQVAPPKEGVEVEEIDSPSRGVSVFEIPLGSAAAVAGQAAPSSVVIWIDDEPGGK